MNRNLLDTIQSTQVSYLLTQVWLIHYFAFTQKYFLEASLAHKYELVRLLTVLYNVTQHCDNNEKISEVYEAVLKYIYDPTLNIDYIFCVMNLIIIAEMWD